MKKMHVVVIALLVLVTNFPAIFGMGRHQQHQVAHTVQPAHHSVVHSAGPVTAPHLTETERNPSYHRPAVLPISAAPASRLLHENNLKLDRRQQETNAIHRVNIASHNAEKAMQDKKVEHYNQKLVGLQDNARVSSGLTGWWANLKLKSNLKKRDAAIEASKKAEAAKKKAEDAHQEFLRKIKNAESFAADSARLAKERAGALSQVKDAMGSSWSAAAHQKSR